MLISHKYYFIYLSNPKTGSTSIRQMLSPYADIVVLTEEQCLIDYQLPLAPHMDAKTLKAFFITQGWDWDKYFKITTIRNPWERLVSYYIFSRPDQNGINFYDQGYQKSTDGSSFSLLDWLEKYKCYEHDFTLNNFVYDDAGNLLVDLIIKLEELNLEMPKLLNKLNLDQIPIIKMNASKHKHYSAYYTHESKELVSKAYAHDIAFGKYVYDNQYKISIVSGTLNRFALLPALLDNTIHANPDLELVIVDGGSTDGTVEYLNSINDPQLKFINYGKRSSYAHFMNLGVQNASHKYIAQWNDDVLLQNTWDEVFELIKNQEYNAYVFSWKSYYIGHVGTNNYIDATQHLFQASATCMNFGIYHKSVFERIGLYNLAYSFYHADSDFLKRVNLFGGKIKLCSDIMVEELSVVKCGSIKDPKTDYDILNETVKEFYQTGLLPESIPKLNPQLDFKRLDNHKIIKTMCINSIKLNNQSPKSTNLDKSYKSGKPGHSDKPRKTGQSNKPRKPGQSNKPRKPGQSNKPRKPGQSNKPRKPGPVK